MGQGVTAVSVRAFSSVVLSLAVMTGGAQASSFIAVGAPSSTPSIIKPGALEPMKAAAANTAAGHASPTSSIVVLSSPLPDVTYEKVAAIPDGPKTKHGFMQNPMIIRGGIVGGAFAVPAPKVATSAPAAPATPATPTTADTKSETKTAASKSAPPVAAAPQPGAGVGKAM